VAVAGAVEHLDMNWFEYVPGYRTPAGTGNGAQLRNLGLMADRHRSAQPRRVAAARDYFTGLRTFGIARESDRASLREAKLEAGLRPPGRQVSNCHWRKYGSIAGSVMCILAGKNSARRVGAVAAQRDAFVVEGSVMFLDGFLDSRFSARLGASNRVSPPGGEGGLRGVSGGAIGHLRFPQRTTRLFWRRLNLGPMRARLGIPHTQPAAPLTRNETKGGRTTAILGNCTI